jgi:hypothetical protein
VERAPRAGGEDRPREGSEAVPRERSEAVPYERSEAVPYEQSEALPREQSEAVPYERSEALPHERSEAVPYERSEALPREREISPATDLRAEALTELAEEIMTLAERVHAQTHRLLTRIAEFDRLQGWKLYGFSSCASWLAYSTRLNKVTAREHVRVARALVGLPEVSAAMARGDLSFSQARAITRVADDENELELLQHARSTSADGLERLTRSWRRLGREDEERACSRRHAERFLSMFPDDHGMYVVRGKLDPESGVLLMRAIEAASDALYRGSVPETTPEQRRADALALLAERALGVGFGGERSESADVRASAEACGGTDQARAPASAETGERAEHAGADASAEAGEGAEQARAPASAETGERAEHAGAPASAETGEGAEYAGADASAEAAPVRAARSDRYLVVLHVDESTLDRSREPGRSDLEDGTRVSAEAARRIACDAGVVRVEHGAGVGAEAARCSAPVVGARTRAVPLRLRRALEVRDRGCKFPGCGSRFTDAHHIRHWADGGATRLDNLILLCRTHHRLLHEGGFRLQIDPGVPGRPIFFSPRGILIPPVPPRVTIRSETEGSRDDPTPVPEPPRWERDVPLALYLKAMEALR